MTCSSCGRRKARRACPALERQICPTCCGTKRLKEIRCPDTCPYLASAREHPAAVVRRQQEHDVAALLPVIRDLSERQQQLFFLFHSLVARHEPEGFLRLLDVDLADAAGALAATLETASRGVVYEHTVQSPPAQRLLTEMSAALAELRAARPRVYDGEVAIALRAVERGARGGHGDDSGEPDAYLALVGRLMARGSRAPSPSEASGPPGSLVLP